MTSSEYVKGSERAMKVLLARGYPRAAAEDAIQATALYFLEHPNPYVTPSLFTQRACQRARDVMESAYGSARRPAWLVAVGDATDLSEFEGGRAVCTAMEGNPND